MRGRPRWLGEEVVVVDGGEGRRRRRVRLWVEVVVRWLGAGVGVEEAGQRAEGEEAEVVAAERPLA